METIRDNINIMFQDLFGTDEHPFFNDIKTVNKSAKIYINNMKKIINHTIEFEPNITIPEGKEPNNTYKILNKILNDSSVPFA